MSELIKKFYQSKLIKQAKEYEAQNWQKNTIIFAPHQDDETLGCGGTIIRKKQAGAKVKIVFMTDGSRSHAHLISPAQLKSIREQEAIAAAQVLGVSAEDVVFLQHPDGGLQKFPTEAITQAIAIIAQFQPEEIFIPYHRDVISDHIATNQIVLAALKQINWQGTVYEYPIWFWRHFPWTGFGNNWRDAISVLKSTVAAHFGFDFLRDFRYRVKINNVLEQKQQALAQHKSQMEQLLPDCGWISLKDVVNGDFLACFYQDHEFFYRRELF
ncbi:MAG: PIG-L family deacetylase [Stanieria sp.]